MRDKINVIAVVGPTASGKTALSVSLAKKFDGEIISADSMQIYKDMQIATAKPTEKELDGVKCYLTDFLPVTEKYSVAEFVNDASKLIFDISSRNKVPIIAGGTGLYVDSLLKNVQFSNESDSLEVKKLLENRFENEGIEVLYEELKKIDPSSAEVIHPNNTKRVIRALEIYYTTGLTMSEQKENSLKLTGVYNVTYIGLNCRDRQKLYDRINLRVDKMIKDGLIDEAKKILSMNLGETSKYAIGYKELKPYLCGNLSFDEAIENLKRETRRYAKRQLTWFRRNSDINWINIDDYSDISEIFYAASEICRRGGFIEK